MKTHTLVQDDQREGLTKEEKDECDMLLGEGFKEWNKKDFSVFKSACERHGRSAFEAVAQATPLTPESAAKQKKSFCALRLSIISLLTTYWSQSTLSS